MVAIREVMQRQTNNFVLKKANLVSEFVFISSVNQGQYSITNDTNRTTAFVVLIFRLKRSSLQHFFPMMLCLKKHLY